MNDNIKAAIAEFIGTFILVFIGILVVTVAGDQGLIVPAFGHGLAVLGMIFAFGHISGTHINPAVTAGLLVGGHIKLDRAVYYWVAQFAGAIVAAIIATLLVADAAANGQTKGTLTDTAVWSAALFEAIQVFILVTVVYQAAAYGKAGNLAGVAIGLTLTAIILAAGVYTGASVNPARTLGPALIAGELGYVIPYFIGLFAGGVAAGALHTYVLKPED